MSDPLTPQNDVPHPGQGPVSPPELGESDDMHPLLRKIVENIKIIITAVAALILVVAGYGVYDYTQEQQYIEASNTFGALQLQNKGAAELEALENFYVEAPSQLQTAVLFAMASAAIDAEDYGRAAEIYSQLTDRVDAPASMLTQIGRARSLAKAGRMQEALAQLDTMINNAPEEFLQQAWRIKASIAEEAQEWKAAQDAYQWLADNAESQDASFFEYKLTAVSAKIES